MRYKTFISVWYYYNPHFASIKTQLFCLCYLLAGNLPEEGLVSPSEKITGSKSAGSLYRLSSILEPDSEKVDTADSCGGSIFSVCSDKLKSSSSSSSSSCFSSDDSNSGGTSWSQPLSCCDQTWNPGLNLLLSLSSRHCQTTVRCSSSPACTAVSMTSWSCSRERWRALWAAVSPRTDMSGWPRRESSRIRSAAAPGRSWTVTAAVPVRTRENSSSSPWRYQRCATAEDPLWLWPLTQNSTTVSHSYINV